MDNSSKNVLVFGSGISGIGAAALLIERGITVTLYDGNEKLDAMEIEQKILEKAAKRSEDGKVPGYGGNYSLHIILGDFPEELFSELDLVVISPGVPCDLPVVNSMRDAGIPIIGEIELAYELGKGEVLAITGTNGKTTTTALLGEIMANARSLGIGFRDDFIDKHPVER